MAQSLRDWDSPVFFNHETSSSGFARNPSSKSGHMYSVVIHAGTQAAEKFKAEKWIAERHQFQLCIFLPLIFLPHLTELLKIFAGQRSEGFIAAFFKTLAESLLPLGGGEGGR